MRIMFMTFIAAAAMFCASGASQAYEGPWCANVSVGAKGIVHDCRYRSFEECAPNVIAGNRGFCTQNPAWPGWSHRATAEPRHHRKRRVEAH
jgi:hypothetical protein